MPVIGRFRVFFVIAKISICIDVEFGVKLLSLQKGCNSHVMSRASVCFVESR